MRGAGDTGDLNFLPFQIRRTQSTLCVCWGRAGAVRCFARSNNCIILRLDAHRACAHVSFERGSYSAGHWFYKTANSVHRSQDSLKWLMLGGNLQATVPLLFIEVTIVLIHMFLTLRAECNFHSTFQNGAHANDGIENQVNEYSGVMKIILPADMLQRLVCRSSKGAVSEVKMLHQSARHRIFSGLVFCSYQSYQRNSTK